MQVSVIGTGYLGAVHAAGLAELGFDVVGIDHDAAKVAALGAGRAPFYEPGLEPLLRKGTESGRLRFTTDVAAAAGADVHFLCVGTPQQPDGLRADLSHLDAAVDALAGVLADGAAGRPPRRPTLVVGKSTVPVGTAARLATRLQEVAGPGVELAWNPEFLREGHAVDDTLRPDRIVLGVAGPTGEQVLRRVYAEAVAAGTPVVVSDLATAELVKAGANAFLATKISFINAMAELCAATGANVTTLAEALGHDVRIGRRFLDAGLGFGGGCLPKDVRALRARAEELGVDALSFLDDVDRVNRDRRTRVVELASGLLEHRLEGRRVAALGASFKPHSDDVRDSPALEVAQRLRERGALVRVYDPVAATTAARVAPDLEYADSAVTACRDADVVLHLTEWPEFRAADPHAYAEVVGRRLVVDARNCLPRDRWREAGWHYVSLGAA
ncbi:UDP-glucose/GDP-mannose dehydrogenase family protein [Nocardioides guangzhouensis]|uniref:UDP-glucose 6-dehydrogenase n=1 Tax=Nocardioides guangzhouensis TaxID=2497878 RepID=A0A4Q4ZK03_9ACTN|nr:UDP-glucose/GDP-mannose dehydrogenase family protein [Nocardioides guangzhouensis]RYP87774.1 UDP-glucose/GDP-mannose dehydrogenase family protein [Nocardioides guangzhouensis]